mmetsp:Transcript_24453/g.37922  ORF Transcript_24453/g.37922 Transcript_24453/m.37922 type:complete len:91 (+) Transcript_24453:52-324(+)
MDIEKEVTAIQEIGEEKQVITNYREILYKTSNGSVGSTAHMLQKSGPFGRSCQFSNHLSKAGNYNNNGLNTTVDHERFMDRSKDWMAKNN